MLAIFPAAFLLNSADHVAGFSEGNKLHIVDDDAFVRFIKLDTVDRDWYVSITQLVAVFSHVLSHCAELVVFILEYVFVGVRCSLLASLYLRIHLLLRWTWQDDFVP